MRCNCCNKLLSDFEATRRFKETKEFVDMCNECVDTLPKDIRFINRTDLDPVVNEEDYYEQESN